MNFKAKKLTEEKIKVMQHYANGGKVQMLKNWSRWEDCDEPLWDWGHVKYRIARPSSKVCWEHVKMSFT